MTSSLVTTIDTDSPPRLIFAGEDLRIEKLPVGTRAIYPPPALPALDNVDGAILHALAHPEGMEPFTSYLRPGMQVSIAIDDISLPLPPMKRPDIRERVLTVLLQQLADADIDNIHLIVANCLHRKMTGPECRRMAGSKVYRAFWPDRFYNFDAEETDALVQIGTTELGEEAWLPRRVVESDLVIYVNINLVPMDGGHKSIGVGLAPYATIKAHHNPETIKKCDSYFDPDASELHTICDRIGKIVEETLPCVFHVETALNNRMFDPALDFLTRNEDHFSRADWIKAKGFRGAMAALPRAAKRAIFSKVPSPYGVTAVHAGEVKAVHDKILAENFKQYCVPVQGQCDIMIAGVPYVSPYSINSILNPLLVHVMGLGYIFNMYRGKPLVRKGGVLILCHHCADEFHPGHHPSYIEFFHRLLPETRDSHRLQHKYEEAFAQNPKYRKMYQEENAYHGVHPFYMWYWGENGRAHVGKVIVVGAENPHVPEILGWERAATMEDAIGRARDLTRQNAEISLFHVAPILMAHVEGN
jgi:lactate racemase